MTDGRKRITRVIAALGITTLGGSVLVSPSYAEPDIDSGKLSSRMPANSGVPM